MNIRLSNKINASNCTTCERCRPWSETIADVEAKLCDHGVDWPHFVIMHGKDLACADALTSTGQKDAGLYIVAVDAHGNEAKKADIFARKDPHYVGVRAVLSGSAFHKTSDDDDDPRVNG